MDLASLMVVFLGNEDNPLLTLGNIPEPGYGVAYTIIVSRPWFIIWEADCVQTEWFEQRHF